MGKIDFNKFKVKYPKDPKPNNKHYRKMIRKIRKDFPKLNG